MPNRTEILHFRATPEEKGRIKENAGHAELHLSEWMRQRSLDRLHPIQPIVKTPRPFDDPGNLRRVHAGGEKKSASDAEAPAEVAWHDIEDAEADPGQEWQAVRDETYEQFIDRRIRELVGEDASDDDLIEAGRTAHAEWAQR